jgi:hypothetical protein
MSDATTNNFVNGLQDAVRQNPVSAALIGMGVLWMFTGGSKITTAAALLGPAARSAAAGVGAGLQASMDAVNTVGGNIRFGGGEVADSVRKTVADAAAKVGETAANAYEAATGAIADSTSPTRSVGGSQVSAFDMVGGAVQENLKATFERQPLLLGALGLAIGAGMAAAVPSTQLEADMMGETAEGVRAKAKEVVAETADKVTAAAERSYQAVKDEAAAQGLTPQAAKDGATAIKGKLKSVAKAARARTSS